MKNTTAPYTSTAVYATPRSVGGRTSIKTRMPKVHRQHKPIAATTASAVDAKIQSTSHVLLKITSIGIEQRV